MRAWPGFVLCAALGCAKPPAAKPPPAPASPAPVEFARAAQPRAAADLAKTFTGRAQPSLVVKNGFPLPQHVFIDWVHRGVLAPASSQTFELDVGTHTVTCADSADPDDNPAAVTEAFDTGYAYVYAIRSAL